MTLDHERLSPEEQLILVVCRPEPYPSRADHAAQLLTAPLDWNRLVPLIAKHKVLPLFWDRMGELDLVKTALRTGGLSKLWAHYLLQLHSANRERTRVFMDMLESAAEQWKAVGLDLAVLKGGALIGPLYRAGNRMLHDIDLAADRAAAGEIRRHLHESGYRYGVFDDATATLRPLGRRAERMWLFYNHTLPPFFKPTGSRLAPYHKVQVGFDFFDTEDEYTFDLGRVAAEATVKEDGSALRVPRPEHMLLNLCCHIYREGVSLVYADVNDNWQLIKFCDLLGYLRLAEREIDQEVFRKLVNVGELDRVCAFAFHYTAQVFPDELLDDWRRLFPADEDTLAPQSREGTRRIPWDEPFEQQLFSLRPHRLARSRWNRSIGQEEW